MYCILNTAIERNGAHGTYSTVRYLIYLYILFWDFKRIFISFPRITASNQIRTGVIGFKVQCANHYTIEAYLPQNIRLSPQYYLYFFL